MYNLTGGNSNPDAIAEGLNSRLNNTTGSEDVDNKDGTVTHYTYNIDAQFTVAHSIDDIKKSDNVIAVVDKVTGLSADGKTPASGVTSRIYGKVAYVQNTGTNDLIDQAYHETGHQLGFIDHFDGDPKDPMDYKAGINRGNNFKSDQVKAIWYNNKYLDPRYSRGEVTRIISTPKDGYNSISTNENPYKGDRRYGMRILAPKKN